MSALPPANAGDNSIVGTWKIQSLVREVIATGRDRKSLAKSPADTSVISPMAECS